MDAWCAPHSRSAELTSNTSKTRHQKRSAETGGRNGDSIAKFRTRRPAHICETSRYRAVFERPSYVTRWRRTASQSVSHGVLKQTALKMCDMADISVDASGARGRSAAISPRICEQSMM